MPLHREVKESVHTRPPLNRHFGTRHIAAKATLALVLLCHSAFSATLVWDANSEPDLAGYKVYSGTSSRQYSSVLDVGDVTQHQLTNLTQGTTYYFALTAYNSAGLESDFSAEISYTPAPANTPPTISGLSNRTISEDTSTGPMSFTIGDAETPNSLVLSVASSNPTLVPNGNMVLGGSGNNRTLTVTPVPNQFGSAMITVSVNDGQLSASNSFVLTINSVNDAPTIANVTDRTIDQNTSTGPIGFVIGDIETAANSLMVTGTSSNPGLVSTQSIVFGGSGSNRTVNVTPASNQSGSATISITVSDGAQTATDSWVLTVRATITNTPPTISGLSNRAIDEDTNTGPMSFTIGDAETPDGLVFSAASSNPTLVPNGNMVLGGSGTNRTLTVTPVPNQFGSATLTVSVSDGQLSATNSFVLTVNAVNDAPTIANMADRTIDQNTSTGPIGLVIGDVESAAGSLTLSGTSSNPTLVPAQNIIFGGSGSNRTVSVTPATNQSGTATINITVSDGGRSASDSWVLTVRATASSNTPPVLSAVHNTTIFSEGTSLPLRFSVSDAQSAPDTLRVWAVASNPSLIPDGNILFQGSGSNRTLTVTAAPSAIGNATITLHAEDGSGSRTSTNFSVSVVARPAELVYLPLEAEAGAVVAPMRRYTNSSVVYVATTSANQGTVTFQFSSTQPGNYIIWARHLSPNGGRDSFFVSVDGAEAVYHTTDTWSSNWQWTRLNAPAGSTDEDPRVLGLSGGTHTVVFRGREANCSLDQIIICNDLEFVPQDGVHAAGIQELNTLGANSVSQPAFASVEVVWNSTPGLIYKVQGKRDKLDNWQDVGAPITAQSFETRWTDPEPTESFTEFRVILVE